MPAAQVAYPISRLRFTFLHTGETATALLRWGDAPDVCAAVVGALPVAGVSHHAAYSGSEAVLVLPDRLRVAPGNATHDVATGDVGFTWFAAGSAHGVTDEFAELCWFYAADARPSMHEGPVPVSLFARFEAPADAFYARCRAMRRAGVTGMLVEALQPGNGATWVAYHDPRDEASLRGPAATVDGADLTLAAGPNGAGLHALLREPGRHWTIGASVLPPDTTVKGAAVADVGRGWLLAIAAVGSPTQLIASRSMDGGRSWSGAQPTGLEGGSPSVARLADGRIAVAFEGDRACRAAVSADGGRSWQVAPYALPDADAPVALAVGSSRLVVAARSRSAARADQLLVFDA